MTVSGCVGGYVTTTEPLKKAVKPVCISQDDRLTNGTAKQIEANNLALQSLNGGQHRCPRTPREVATS